jgi:hypothetical protein
VLRDHGVRVLTVREILAHGVDEHMGARVQLENLAMATLTYQVGLRGGAAASAWWEEGTHANAWRWCAAKQPPLPDPCFQANHAARHASWPCRRLHPHVQVAAGHSEDDITEADRRYLGDKYKREVRSDGAAACAAAWGVYHPALGAQSSCPLACGGSAQLLSLLHPLLPMPFLMQHPRPCSTPPLAPPRAPPPCLQVIEHMSVTQLIDLILINPTVSLAPSYRDTGLTASYTFEPLSNLVYTRDQQV